MKAFLIGYTGCGKSSLGRKIARALRCRFVDTDSEAERREGASVADIFAFEGEKRFRELEREVLDDIVADETDAVVATGGGLPLFGDNMAAMNAAGVTIYIRRSAQGIVGRLSPYGIRKRPRFRDLTADELPCFIERDMGEREPFYTRARYVFDADGMSDEELTKRITDILRNE